MNLTTDIIGYIGSFLISIIFIPQIIHIYKTSEVNAISYSTQMISILSAIFMLIYGYLINSIPIIICNIVVGLTSFIICCMKYYYTNFRTGVQIFPIDMQSMPK